ncbi:TonB-dependent receptor plug domain-containing protein [Zhongshania sp.]|uniref:TonB-dependent receptor plug domain-containing protein n=1 Tax=Zhongshania sp. TaxID=1971902 RepID=UPI0035668EA3
MPKYRRLFGPLLASEQVCSAIAVVVIATISHVCVADQASYEGVEEDAWQRQLENSLGATLAKTVGVDASYFGDLSSRPVLRGFGGERIRLLVNNIAITDLSAYSTRFNVALDPLSARGATVLDGLESLVFGSGLIGGVVDLDVPLVPMTAIEGLHWDWASRGSSHDAGAGGYGRIALGNGNWAVHLDGLIHQSDDYDAPDSRASSDNEIANTDGNVSGEGVGVSWTNEGRYFGLGYSRHANEYGLGTTAGGDIPRVNLELQRYELRTGGVVGKYGLDTVKLALVRSEYQHQEPADNFGLEDLFPPTESGNFELSDTQLRIDLLTMSLWGWQSRIGFQTQDRSNEGKDFNLDKPSERSQAAVYWIPQREIGSSRLSLGMRVEDTKQKFGEVGGSAKENPLAIWTALETDIDERNTLRVSLGHGQRAPGESELQNAPVAVSEVDSRLAPESSYNAGLAYRGSAGLLAYRADIRASRIDDYIEKSTGSGAPRNDVDHYSGDVAISYQFNQNYSFGAYVRNIPLGVISPQFRAIERALFTAECWGL